MHAVAAVIINGLLSSGIAIDPLILDIHNCFSTAAVYPRGLFAHNLSNYRGLRVKYSQKNEEANHPAIPPRHG
jgi:hypothetical protein